MSSVRAPRADRHARSKAGEIVVTIDASLCQTYSRKLPTRCGRKEVAVSCANMILWSDARPSPEDHQTEHEFAVVFAHICSSFTVSAAHLFLSRPWIKPEAANENNWTKVSPTRWSIRLYTFP